MNPMFARLRLFSRAAFALALLLAGAAIPCLTAAERPAAEPARPPLPATMLPRGAGSDYRIGPRDLVQFQIYEEADVQAVQRVSNSGEISVPMLGPVRLAGLTLREAERRLEQAYIDKGYFVQLQVM